MKPVNCRVVKMNASLLFVFIASSLTFGVANSENNESPPRDHGAYYCLLPPYPQHGQYIVTGYPSAKPGHRYPSALLTVSCDTGYRFEYNNYNIFCVHGLWSATMPQCIRFCSLKENLSVEYRCELSGPGSVNGSRECGSSVLSGDVVTPICRAPGYFSLRPLDKMHCIDGIWDNQAVCKPACGIITQHRQLEGSSTNHLELPWHAVIYKKSSDTNYSLFCGGSLISSKIIISAAHCFWGYVSKFPASDYLVAVGKLYRPYKDPRDQNSQYSNVTNIETLLRYVGAEGDFQYDLAILVVETPFLFFRSVRPVCLDFDYLLDENQLTEGDMGRTVRWINRGSEYQLLPVLEVNDFPYIKSEDCLNIAPTHFQHYITSDKFCVGPNNGTSQLCNGNSGSGIAFLEPTTQRYYLRGVLAGGIINLFDCTIFNTYTSIIKHEHFIKQYL